MFRGTTDLNFKVMINQMLKISFCGLCQYDRIAENDNLSHFINPLKSQSGNILIAITVAPWIVLHIEPTEKHGNRERVIDQRVSIDLKLATRASDLHVDRLCFRKLVSEL